MHLTKLTLLPEKYPTVELYPFNLEVLRYSRSITFRTPVSFFIGENGTGKSTLLRAIARRCDFPIWKEEGHRQFHNNKYADELYKYMTLEWVSDKILGSFFGSEIFQSFAEILDEWATADPAMLDYFGGESLVTKSHGQCNLTYFKNRYQYKGLHLLDEPETALSPKKQLEFLKIIKEISEAGQSQFIIATHSPILLALPGADIYSFDSFPIERMAYEETDYYLIYKNFLNERERFLGGV